MIALLSPAKSLDYDSPLLINKSTKPRLMNESADLVKDLKKLSAKDVGKLMSISDKLADLNHGRFQSWNPTPTKSNARQALLAFTGDVYQGMELADWSADDFTTAQQRLRILSGLYGLLRPLDLMQPYRLEMGTKFKNPQGKDLYAFWGDQLTKLINTDLKKSGSDHIVNLASNEYFSSVQPTALKGQLITPVFKDEKNGKYKIISFYAKKARGMMADYIVRKNITDATDLKKFKTAGYKFSKSDSTETELLFTRKEQKGAA